MRMSKICATIGIIFWGFQVLATPAQVVIIRHGEKPPKGNQVNQQGCERAFSLPDFFQKNSTVNAYGPAVAIYGMAPSSADGTIRCIQVIAPTAKQMGLMVDSTYARKDIDAIAKEILSEPSYNGKTVLVAWEHSVIIDLATALGLANAQAPSQDWPDEVYDQAWILDFTSNKQNQSSLTLNIIPEYVLPTDNPLGGLDHWADGPQTPGASSPVLSSQIQSECVDNNALNTIVREVAKPSLKESDFAN